jgi:hypothetical protein
MVAGVVYEHTSHHVRGHGEELHPVGPLGSRLVHEAEIRLVNECRRGECMPGRFEPELAVRDARQVGVHEGDEAVHRARRSVPHGAERVRDRVLLRTRCHVTPPTFPLVARRTRSTGNV